MKVFIISLKDATERRKASAAQLEKIGLEFEFFDALDSIDEALGSFKSFNGFLYRLNTRRDAIPGEIGCYGSHRALWKTCVTLREPILILEDDFLIQANFMAALAETESLIRSFGLIRLQSTPRRYRRNSHKHKPATNEVSRKNGFQLDYVADVPLCLLAYAINPQSAAALLEASTCLSAPVDKFLQKTWKHRVPVYALNPPPVRSSQHSPDSTIGSRPRKSWSIGLLFLRLAYKGLGDLRRIRFNRKQLVRLGLRKGTEPNGGQQTGLDAVE